MLTLIMLNRPVEAGIPVISLGINFQAKTEIPSCLYSQLFNESETPQGWRAVHVWECPRAKV